MAPEQAHTGVVDARADIYALACVLYELCTGRLPYVAHSPVALVEMKRRAAPEPMRVRARALGLPAELDQVILRAFVAQPDAAVRERWRIPTALEAVLEAPQRRRSIPRVAGYALLGAAGLFGACLLGAAHPWTSPSETPAASRIGSRRSPTACPRFGNSRANWRRPSNRCLPCGPRRRRLRPRLLPAHRGSDGSPLPRRLRLPGACPRSPPPHSQLPVAPVARVARSSSSITVAPQRARVAREASRTPAVAPAVASDTSSLALPRSILSRLRSRRHSDSCATALPARLWPRCTNSRTNIRTRLACSRHGPKAPPLLANGTRRALPPRIGRSSILASSPVLFSRMLA